MEIPGTMKVSVLMPLYNKAPYLGEAVKSILAQPFQDFELVDDASTDGSAEVLRSIAGPRARIITNARNIGPAGAAQRGMDACTGEYIVRLDADDIAVPDRLNKQVAFMDAHPDLGASGGHLALFGEQDTVWPFPLTDDACKAELLFGVPISQGTMILRRSVIQQHDIRYDDAWPRVGEDWLFWTRLAPHTRFANLDEPITRYRRGAMNSSHDRDRLKDHEVILKQVFAMLGIQISDEQLGLHLMALRMFREAPTVRSLYALRRWLDQLKEMNATRALFPQEVFDRRVECTWTGLFHLLPHYGTSVALAHLKITGTWSMQRLLYLLKYRLNTIFGRGPGA